MNISMFIVHCAVLRQHGVVASADAKSSESIALQFCSLKRLEGALAAARPKAERARLPHCALLITPTSKYEHRKIAGIIPFLQCEFR